MKFVSFNQTKAKGFSLIELLLVLGVLAILLVAAFVVYPQVRDRNQANAEVANLTAMKANVTNLYASKGGNYAGLNQDIANQARVFPSSMNGGSYTPGTRINSSWGGEVVVEEDPSNSRRFNVRYTMVPAGVCLGLVSGAATNFLDVEVGPTGSEGFPSVFNSDGTFNPGAAANLCADGDTGTWEVRFISN